MARGMLAPCSGRISREVGHNAKRNSLHGIMPAIARGLRPIRRNTPEGYSAVRGDRPHEHLILWGSLDPFISHGDMEETAATMPDCRLLVIPDVGHSLLIERPEIYVQHFVRMFSPD